MRLRSIILCLFLIGFSTSIFGQDKKSKYSKSKQSNAELLDEARASKGEDPTYAIKLVEQVLRDFNPKKQKRRKKKSKDQKLEAEAYTLLGEIYEGINQNQLALQRYQQAMSVWKRSKAPHTKEESE